MWGTFWKNGWQLEELLGAAMEVPDDRLAVDDPLAVQLEPQAEDAVGGGVLRAEVEHHLLALAGEPVVRLLVRGHERAVDRIVHEVSSFSGTCQPVPEPATGPAVSS